MANRLMDQFKYSLEKKICQIYCDFTVGGTGAPTLVSLNSKGVTSITRNSAGKYTIVLDDNYTKFLGGHISVINAVAAAAPITQFWSASPSTGTIVIQLLDAAGAAADLASGAEVVVKMELGNTSVP